jgi:hypothetical protein
MQTEPAKSQSEPVKSPVQPTSSDQAQDLTELSELKAKIWEAEVAQRNFAAGLPHCSELNRTNFYFSKQNRLLDLQDYRRSLDNLVTQGVFNRQDADARWAQVQKQATTDQANCTAVASLPSWRCWRRYAALRRACRNVRFTPALCQKRKFAGEL